MSKITFEAEVHGDHLHIVAYEAGVYQQDFVLDTENAEALATAIMDALVAASAEQVESFTEPDPREQMGDDLRAAMNGVRVRIGADAYALMNNGMHDEVYFDEGTEATIMSWEDYEAEWGKHPYSTDENFPLVDDEGTVQVVQLDSCEPVDRAAVRDRALEVGARWAEALGIVPGATVNLPPITLAAALFGRGEVVNVDGGKAEVRVETADVVEDFLVTSLAIL